ncbi:hypothetical protein HGM15179_000199 [Zosterops borbonicus]|uniref:Uncharacterized protein n=1 Tax=Zosterops borbonicus TaxID=364589 RepID=A0A8K1LU14_9PASS|nr:hypothetical protein HGM15179_000199 [Zosterops borbonicus]
MVTKLKKRYLQETLIKGSRLLVLPQAFTSFSLPNCIHIIQALTLTGLDKLHNLMSCSSICYELHVDLWTASNSVCDVYDFFQVASSRDRYRLSVRN